MLTTLLDVVGALLVVLGVFFLAGVGAALVVAGAGVLVVSFVRTRQVIGGDQR